MIQYLTNYEFLEKDWYNLITSIQDDKFEQILENLPIIDEKLGEAAHQRRRLPKIQDVEFSNYKKRFEHAKFDITRQPT